MAAYNSLWADGLLAPCWVIFLSEELIMSDLDRGIMQFKGADSWPAVTLSAILILGAIAALILWALQSAYAI